MKTSRNTKVLLGACLVALAMPFLLRGADTKSAKDSLTGNWDCVAHLSGEDDIPFTMTLTLKDDTVTGSVGTHDGDLQITAGSYKGGTLELHMDSPEAKYSVTGKLDGNQFKGTWSKDPDGMGGEWEGKRSAPAK